MLGLRAGEPCVELVEGGGGELGAVEAVERELRRLDVG